VTSIRRKLLFTLLGAMLIALLVGAWATYRAEVQQADILFDYHLRQIALALRDRVFDRAAAPPLQSDDSAFDYSIQVWNQDGVTVYYSYPQHVFPNRAQLGYTTVQTEEGPWRVFAMQSRAEIIQVAQPMSRRNQLAAHAAWQSLRPFLLLFPVMGGLIWLVVGQGLTPIARLAAAIAARTPAAMEPVPEDVPLEVHPLVQALNDLLSRLRAALESQRQFVADAAHQLRTPLAALQLQTQLVERASSDAERSAALAELNSGLQRTTRVVQQLLTLAREEPGAVQSTPAPVRLDALIDSLVDEYRAIDFVTRLIDQGALPRGTGPGHCGRRSRGFSRRCGSARPAAARWLRRIVPGKRVRGGRTRTVRSIPRRCRPTAARSRSGRCRASP